LLCHKAAGKWVEMDKGERKGVLKPVQESIDEAFLVVCCRRFGKEKALLDIVRREHGKIQWCQVKGPLRLYSMLWFNKAL
jgi:hypothetical protein